MRRHALAGPVPVFSCFSADSDSSIPGLTISSTHTSSFPRRIPAPGVCTFASLTPNRGVGGAPRNVRVRPKHPLGVPSCVKDARERACDAARQALARRLRPIARQDARERAYDAGRSPLGAPSWRLSPPLIPAQAGIQKLGPRFRGDERKRLTPLPAPPSGSSPETPLNERGCSLLAQPRYVVNSVVEM